MGIRRLNGLGAALVKEIHRKSRFPERWLRVEKRNPADRLRRVTLDS
jgi:hypothetical protein